MKGAGFHSLNRVLEVTFFKKGVLTLVWIACRSNIISSSRLLELTSTTFIYFLQLVCLWTWVRTPFFKNAASSSLNRVLAVPENFPTCTLLTNQLLSNILMKVTNYHEIFLEGFKWNHGKFWHKKFRQFHEIFPFSH